MLYCLCILKYVLVCLGMAVEQPLENQCQRRATVSTVVGTFQYVSVLWGTLGNSCTVHCMEDNFVQFFLGLIQLFLNLYQRLDIYTWYFVRFVTLALIYSPETVNLCKQWASIVGKSVFASGNRFFEAHISEF